MTNNTSRCIHVRQSSARLLEVSLKEDDRLTSSSTSDVLTTEDEQQRIIRQKICHQAQTLYQEQYLDSDIPDKTRQYPKFAHEELQLGNLLGKGGFCTVYEIMGFDVPGIIPVEDEDDPVLIETTASNLTAGGRLESRQFIAQHCLRGGGNDNNNDNNKLIPRYAMKQLSEETIEDPQLFFQGIADLNTEARILAAIEHPNIIKLRAMASGPRFSEGYFIVLDRLHDTLDQRHHVDWQQEKKALNHVKNKLLDPRGMKKATFFGQRLVFGYDLCSALSYLHAHKICHRDLKPENIGFDIRGDIKIFDFGLAREIPFAEDDDDNNNNNNNKKDTLYEWTEMCGTPRYMAPEVGLGQPYNELCDVYSFTIVFWEMMTLGQAYHNHPSTEDLMKKIWQPPYFRPMIPPKWSKTLKTLFHKAWSPRVSDRPTMAQMEHFLKEEATKQVHKVGGTTTTTNNIRQTVPALAAAKNMKRKGGNRRSLPSFGIHKEVPIQQQLMVDPDHLRRRSTFVFQWDSARGEILEGVDDESSSQRSFLSSSQLSHASDSHHHDLKKQQQQYQKQQDGEEEKPIRSGGSVNSQP